METAEKLPFLIRQQNTLCKIFPVRNHAHKRGKRLVGLLALLVLLLGFWFLWQGSGGLGGFSRRLRHKRLFDQGLVIPGDDQSYAQTIAESYRLLVERYVVPVSPKLMYESAISTMELVEQSWLPDAKDLEQEALETIVEWEREAHFAADAHASTRASTRESARAPARAPAREQLAEDAKNKRAAQFTAEYLAQSPENLQKAYEAALARSRAAGRYSKAFAKRLYTEALAALCRPLHDPFSGFFQNSDFFQLSDTTNGSYGGVGLYLAPKPLFLPETKKENTQPAGARDYQFLQRHYVKVSRPFPGGPSFRAGIMADDFIYAVNGESAKDWTTEQVQHKVRGRPGSKVQITVLRARKHELAIDLVREKIEIPAVKSALIPATAPDGSVQNIGYVDLSQFNAVAGEQFRQQVRELLRPKKDGKNSGRDGAAQALLLDMRDNPGGLLSIAVEIADQFLSSGVIVTTDARTSDNILEFRAKKRTSIPPNLPVFVMVNSESASAAEIVAGALQDNGRAQVLGEKSFGKGSVQSPITLPEGILKITIAHFYTPKGINLANNGIQPDREFAVPVLDEAEREGLVELLNNGAIADFVGRNRSYTEQEFADFFAADIQPIYNISEQTARRFAYREKIRYLAKLPVYNFEYDPILKNAVDYILANLRQKA